ncbi:MAG: hypothetical protein IJ820_05790 [Lachnospiraceae bacterium]|nr:hypothetical protein [Lachnospiraceae bacterium]
MMQDRDRENLQEPEIRRVDLMDHDNSLPTGRRRNTELSIVTWIFVILFAMLIGRVVYILVAQSDSLRSNINNTKADSNSENVIQFF